MEVYSIEIDLGQLKIEVSIQDASPRIRFNDNTANDTESDLKVYLTAKDENLRRIWRTPIVDKDGKPKIYHTIEEALTDASEMLQEKQ